MLEKVIYTEKKILFDWLGSLPKMFQWHCYEKPLLEL